jgi:crotonobetainyl-CoA:carnitine CoA-transferase CaiB-like acyl-CoA transferase
MSRCLEDAGMGPLAGVKIVEFTGIGPAPMAAMMLADMGATIIRIDRTGPSDLGIPMAAGVDFTKRSRAAIGLDLKRPEATRLALRLIDGADALIEGFRPGVMERLGLGPDICLKRNPKLAYGRVTGWGQDGPLALAAGHDLNYIALTGALHAIGRKGQKPTPPLNLVGDYGGGALYLVTGLLAAIISARSTGHGQVVDAAMVDGALSLMTPIYAMKAGGRLTEPRGENQLDSGAYFYETYECSDGQFICVAAIEAKFHAELLRRLELDPARLPPQWEKSKWPDVKERLTALFRTRTRDGWCHILEGTDVCFAPVLSMDEAHAHPHNVARQAFIDVGGIRQPAPAPRFGTTGLATPMPPGSIDPRKALLDWGLTEAELAELNSEELSASHGGGN